MSLTQTLFKRILKYEQISTSDSNMTTLVALEDNIYQHELRIKYLEDHLKILMNIVTERRNEKYYQTSLEKMLGASHKVTKYGITDISTDDFHLEIKHWNNYKSALGQILSYNHNDNKRLIVAFFGECNRKDDIIQLFQDNFIDVWILHDTPDSIAIEKFEDGRSSVLKIIRQYYEHGDKKDFVKRTDIKRLLRANGIHLSLEQLQHIVLKCFPNAVYKENSRLNNKNMRSFFTVLKPKMMS
uniref:Uncharacterized protein n=1 Tax=viral metagenome TaxID=1070528 RepID=A0A6C0E1N9_9ZZZZ